MRIDDIRPDSSRADRTRPATPVAGPAPAKAAEPVQRDAGDQVEISAEARALAALQQAADPAEALSPERLAELRRWIQAGGHNDAKVIEQVARRLLSSGEV